MTTLERTRKVATAREWSSNGVARVVRSGAGLSLGEMAELVGVAISTIKRWEDGAARPRGERAVRYADALHTLMQPDWHMAARNGGPTSAEGTAVNGASAKTPAQDGRHGSSG